MMRMMKMRRRRSHQAVLILQARRALKKVAGKGIVKRAQFPNSVLQLVVIVIMLSISSVLSRNKWGR